MKRFAFFVCALALCLFSVEMRAQAAGPAFTTMPTSFTIDDSVTITFNAAAANACPSMTSDAAKTLAGFSGQVFLHGSASTNDNWGSYEPDQMWGSTQAPLRWTQVGAGRWQLRMLPRAFYRIPAAIGRTEVKNLFVIVRSGDCGSSGKPDCREGKIFNADRSGCTDPRLATMLTSVNSKEYVAATAISPNPFYDATNFNYVMSKQGRVTIRIYNMLGQAVKTVMVNELRQPGSYVIGWNGDDDNYVKVPSGSYTYRVESEGTAQTGQIVLNR
jgi:hypothetical protein